MKSASLNHIYRLVWNEATNTYVAVAEHIAGRGKRTSGVAGVFVAASLVLLAGGAARAQALPTGAAIAAGAATISQSGGQMTVTQATQRLVTNWNSFDVGAGASVRFVQPNASAIALNRVTGGGAASAIDGSLSANGNVWLLNPNGVVFGSGAQVNVGGLVASSLGLSDGDFLAGRTRFTGGAGAGAVVNHGTIRTASGGVVALVAPRVTNTGSIATPGGSTALAAGETVSLDFQGDGLVSVRVERGVADAAVENSGRITAEGGLVTLSARGADAVLGSVVNNTGVIEAHGLVARDGRILLDGDTADGGTTHVAGTLDVTSAGGRGGAIVVTGKAITLDGGASLDASGATGGGTVNVGGGWQGKDAAIANATTVTADASVTARADATGNGDGGKVVAWSDGATTFAGRTSARGGAQGGDGGDIEVSGKGKLHYSGRADALAPHGRTGNLLLDPATIDIQGGGTGTGAVNGSIVYERDLEAQNANVLLEATGNMTVQNLALNGGDGRISMANNVSLRMEAGTSGSGNITFANAANTLEVFGTGSLMMVTGRTGSGVITNAPNLIAHGVGTNPSTLPNHSVTAVGSGTPGAGSITLYGADGVTVGGSVTTNGGYVRVWADSDNAGGGGYSMSAPVTTNGGNFYVSAGSGNIDLNSNMTLGSGRIVFRADGSWTNGTRTLGGVISANGPVTVDSPFVMNAGSGIYTDGAITFTSSVNLNTGAGALTLRASDIDFSNATVTNVSTASIVLQPYDVTTNINLNGATTGIARATTFTKLAGIKNLTIGRADGTGVTTVPTTGFGFSASDTLRLLNGSIAIDGALTNTNASGRVVAQAGQGDVTLATAGSVTASGTGNAVVLAARRNFVDNNASASAISAANGRWLVYSTTPDNDTRGSLVNGFKQYNINYGGTAATDTVLGTGNGFLYRVAPVVGVALTGTVRKVYDGTNAATVTTANLTNTGGAIDGDAVTFAVGPNGSAIYDTKNAGTTKQVNVSGIAIDSATNAGVRVYGYQFSPTASATVGEVDKRVLATTSNGGIGVQAAIAGKTYDGNTTASVTGITLANKIAGDDLTATASSATFDTRNAGTGKTVTVSGIQYAGVDAGNYDLTTTTTTTTAAITPKTVTATASVADKVYDGGTSATISGVAFTGVVAGDVLASGAGSAGTFADKNVGAAKNVTGGAIVLAGADAGNYVVDAGSTIGTAAITPRTITATATVTDKVYDGNTTASIGNVAFNGVVAGDALASGAGSVGAFDTKNASTGKTVTGGGIVLTGADAGNYALDTTAAIGTAAITPKTLTATATVADKVYDGGTAASIANVAFNGVVVGDTIASGAGSVGTFADKNVGAGKNVTGGAIVLAGADAGNYVVDAGSNIGTAAITPKALTATASVADKVYDGNTTATLGNVALVGVVAGDQNVVGATGASGSFIDKNAGTGKVVSGSGVALSGSGAGNYSFDTTAQIGTASITPKTVTATASVANKVYDGGTSATLSNVAFTGIVAGDTLTNGAGSVGTFADKNVGTGKNVTGGAIVLAGADAGNYVVNAGSTIGTASITPKTVTATASVANKVYDGGTSATLSNVAFTGIVAGDALASGAGSVGAFADKNAGAGKNVTGSGIVLTGTDAGNYVVNAGSTIGTATITPKTLTATANVADKVYDGSTGAAISNVAFTGIVAGDALTSGAGSAGTFADKNVGAGKNVTGGAIVLTGADAGNYVVDAGSAIGTATISPRILTATATVVDKVYDGSRTATLGNLAFNGVVAGDALASGATSVGLFNDKNAGTGKNVTGGGIVLTGADAGNYVVNAGSTIGTGAITPKTITATANVADKVYDGGTAASIANVAFNGVVAGDVLASGAGSVGAFADKNAGTGKAVTGGGIVLTGADAGNYTVNAGSNIGTATITPKTITATAAVADKVYDGTARAAIANVAFSGVVAGDALTSGAGSVGTFDTKNAGTAKNVTGGAIVLAGADAGNYRVDAGRAIGTGAITPKTITATASVTDKVYDGGTSAAIDNVAFAGVIAGDALTSGAGSVGTFDTKNAGAAKNVTGGAIVLAGADAGNYRVDATRAIGTATISPKLLAASGTIGDKVYDGTTTAQITGVTLAGVVAGDIGRVTASDATGRYGNKNVGTGKAVTGSGLGLSGSEAGNYALDTGAVVGTGRITPKTLMASGANVLDKIYDGTAIAEVTGLVLGGVIAGDDVSGNGGTARFASADVGTDKAVTVGALSLAGRDAGNYALDRTVTGGSASIVPLRNDTSAATALIATPVGANGTAVITTRTLEPAPAPTDTTAQASLAVLVTGRATAPATPQATPAVVNAGAFPAQVQAPLVLTDAVLTSQGRLSLALENGVPAAVPQESSVPIYSERASQDAPKSEGRYTVVDRGTDVLLALVGNAASLAPLAITTSSGARTTETAVLQADGGALALRVTLLTDGTLTVQVPDAGTAQNAETLTAYALATAKQRFGITVRAVKAVVVQYGPLAANMTGGAEKVAGL